MIFYYSAEQTQFEAVKLLLIITMYHYQSVPLLKLNCFHNSLTIQGPKWAQTNFRIINLVAWAIWRMNGGGCDYFHQHQVHIDKRQPIENDLYHSVCSYRNKIFVCIICLNDHTYS